MSVMIRPNVKQMRPYSPGKPIDEVKRELGLTRVIKLASNENAFGASARALEAIKRAANSVNLYPDATAFELVQALAEHLGIPANQVAVGNGSDELIHVLGLLMLDHPDDEVVMGDPSFVRYGSTAELGGCKLIAVPLTPDHRHDLPAMARAVTDRTRLVFIANPNNPTGTVVDKTELDAFLGSIPDSVLVVLDEAYFEFAQGLPDFPNAVHYAKTRSNVVGLRTFSKAYGLAGLRCGYAFGPKEIIDAIHSIREPFNVNSIAQAAALAALDDQAHLKATLEFNRRGIIRLVKAMVSLGVVPCESYANFVFADLGRPTVPIFESLLRRGIIVRAGAHVGGPNNLRVTVGTEEEIEMFVEAFGSVMREAVTA